MLGLPTSMLVSGDDVGDFLANRNNTTQDRLNSLALLSTESNVLHMLDPDFWLSNFLYWRKESFEALILKEKVIWLTNGDKQGIIYFSAFWCGCFVVTVYLYRFSFFNFLKSHHKLCMLSELYTHRAENCHPLFYCTAESHTIVMLCWFLWWNFSYQIWFQSITCNVNQPLFLTESTDEFNMGLVRG